MDNALSLRLDRIRDVVRITDICPEVSSQGSSTCPACGRKSKASVWDNRNLKCWSPSCSLKGSQDVLSLYRNLRGLNEKSDFMKAVQDLEHLGNISFTKNYQSANERSEFLEECLFLFQNYLWGPEGVKALEYLRSRGFDNEVIKALNIGYAPNGGCLRAYEHISPSELRKHGLLKYTKEYMDNRIIFPIKDMYGKYVHFVGRYLGEVPKDENGEDKFLRYKDTDKSSALADTKAYLAFEEHIQGAYSSKDYVVLTEGFPDALTWFQAGVPALGILGIQKLKNHVFKLKGFKEIICIFDSDRFSTDHPTHPNEFKSWITVLPQIVDLQLLLPNLNFYIWMVPEVVKTGEGKKAIKDVNDWFRFSGLSSGEHWNVVNREKEDLTLRLIKQWGDNLSNHQVLLKLIQSTGKGTQEIAAYVPNNLNTIEYALKVLG